MIRCPLPGVPGALFLHSIPGRWETLAEFREGVEAERLTRIVVLLDDAEIARRSPGYAELLAESPPWLPPRRRVPMEDFGTPLDGPDAFVAAARAVATELREGVGSSSTAPAAPAAQGCSRWPCCSPSGSR